MVGEQGRGDEQPRDKERNPARLQGFGSSFVQAAVQGGEELPGLGLHTHTGPSGAGCSWVSAPPKYFWDYYYYLINAEVRTEVQVSAKEQLYYF